MTRFGDGLAVGPNLIAAAESAVSQALTALDALVADCVEKFGADPARIYLMGFSMGGGTALVSAARSTGAYPPAAVASSAGFMDLLAMAGKDVDEGAFAPSIAEAYGGRVPNAGLAAESGRFDVLQDGSDVLLVGASTVAVVDPATVSTVADVSAAGVTTSLGGGTVPIIFLTECTWMRKRAVRTPEWKLIVARDHPDIHGRPPVELYDLRSDPGEQRNVAEQRPEVVAALRGELEHWLVTRQRETGLPDPVEQQEITLRQIGKPPEEQRP